MGNTNRRPLFRSTATPRKPSLQTAQLAPVETIDVDSRDYECPICFINYSALNVVSCCKQSICTQCYTQLKASPNDCACPFCGRTSLTASYAPPAHPTKSLDRSPTEAEEKQSSEFNSPQRTSSLSSVPSSSKSDREALEREIRAQRLQYVEEDLPPAPSPPSRSVPHRHSEPSPHSPHNRPVGIGRGQWQRRRTQGGGGGGYHARMYDGEGGYNSPLRPSTPPADPTERLLSSLHSLLEASEFDRVAGLEQLEEIMLMEAIRQSMSEAHAMGTFTGEGETFPAPAPARQESLPPSAPDPLPPTPPPEPERVMSSPQRLIAEIERALATPPHTPSTLRHREEWGEEEVGEDET